MGGDPHPGPFRGDSSCSLSPRERAGVKVVSGLVEAAGRSASDSRPSPATDPVEMGPAEADGAGGEGPEEAEEEAADDVGDVVDAEPDAAGGDRQGEDQEQGDEDLPERVEAGG